MVPRQITTPRARIAAQIVAASRTAIAIRRHLPQRGASCSGRATRSTWPRGVLRIVFVSSSKRLIGQFPGLYRSKFRTSALQLFQINVLRICYPTALASTVKGVDGRDSRAPMPRGVGPSGVLHNGSRLSRISHRIGFENLLRLRVTFSWNRESSCPKVAKRFKCGHSAGHPALRRTRTLRNRTAQRRWPRRRTSAFSTRPLPLFGCRYQPQAEFVVT